MTEIKRRTAAKQFTDYWEGKGYEKGQSQTFWLSLLRDVYGVEKPGQMIKFEDQIMLDHTSFIDGHIKETHVLIEQKSIDKDLRKAIKQSDGSLLTPFQQAKRYSAELPYDDRPRWIVTCNFKSFLIYDMNNPNGEPEEVLLKNLPDETYRLEFLVDAKNKDIVREMEISIKAGEIVGKLYEALLKQYINPENPESLKNLNMLCVRLVFCLYAEDAGIFGKHGMFKDYLKQYQNPSDVRKALIELFDVLNQETGERDPYIDATLGAFPYVNGGLFEQGKIEIPGLSQEIVDLLIHDASEDFDWKHISPTIFGAVFESTLNPETRRSGGMHYTSIENIHKVIDPLFLDELREEFDQIKAEKVTKYRKRQLESFQDKLANLIFLDPACGSGNFLTESYLSLRQLENDILITLLKDPQGTGNQIFMGNFMEEFGFPIKVSIHQFYGIEINDFAVSVAKTALWIAEAQMMKRTEDIIHMHLDFLPLKSYANIIEGNALRTDWEKVISKDELNYIIGNPPFVGYSLQSKDQKNDLLSVYIDEKGKPYKTAGKIDFVAGWYFKAAQLMNNTAIRTAFVSTNSITQGEQVAGVWKPLYDRFNIHIDFAYQTFKWESEASAKAAVHCVIIGFSQAHNSGEKRIYSGDMITKADIINPYLVEAPEVFIEALRKPISMVPLMHRGSQPTDDGNLIFIKDEMEDFLKLEPNAEKWIRPFMMGKDFIDRKPRYCLWLVDANLSDVRHCKSVMKQVQKVKEFRENSKKAATRKKAETPMYFDENQQPETNFIAIPVVSSERRRYIPMDFMDPETIVGNKLFVIEDAELFHFGILTSNVHMAWMRTVAGRLKSDYSYSNTIVYNNFPWPESTEQQKAMIEKTAQGILDARALFQGSSLADLYDEVTMPKELRKAHQLNDKAVLAAYGFAGNIKESDCVAELMKLYQSKIN
jgi:type I restriction-modification system DNA methylase subunit